MNPGGTLFHRHLVHFYSALYSPEEYWLVTTGEQTEPGINGGLMKRRGPDARMFHSINVDSVDRFLQQITANGGQVVVPKMAIPGVGYIAYGKDTEDVIFGIFETDKNAK